MACGTPVVCAKSQALVEIAEDAALFADPKKPEDLARAITKILKNEKTKKLLVKKGFERAKKFSWKRAAKETVEYYKEVIGGQ
jgi:glycosyltransferase involved in cell wall biosynthesis